MKENQEILYPRKCDKCGKGMNEGYCWDMGWACSDECLYVDGYTKKQFKEDYEMDCIYYTEWDELDCDINYTEQGQEVDNKNCTCYWCNKNN